jgi:hypothetical protein
MVIKVYQHRQRSKTRVCGCSEWYVWISSSLNDVETSLSTFGRSCLGMALSPSKDVPIIIAGLTITYHLLTILRSCWD